MAPEDFRDIRRVMIALSVKGVADFGFLHGQPLVEIVEIAAEAGRMEKEARRGGKRK